MVFRVRWGRGQGILIRPTMELKLTIAADSADISDILIRPTMELKFL